MKTNNKHCGEIIQASSTQFQAAMWDWQEQLPQASLVCVEHNDVTIFGLVYNQQTTAEAGRTIFPYRLNKAELAQQHPEVFAFLQTTLSCIILGYKKGSDFHHIVPAMPPQPHDFIRPATKEEHTTFYARATYIHALYSQASMLPGIDEILLCLLQRLQEYGLLESSLEEFIEEYSQLIGGDYRRLKIFLSRVQRLLQQ